MAWLYNLRMRTKLLVSFIMVALITGIVGYVGINKIQLVEHDGIKLYDGITVPMGELGAMSTTFQRVRINLREYVETADPQEKASSQELIKTLRAEIEEKAASFEKTILTDEGHNLFNQFRASRDAYGSVIDRVVSLSNTGKDAEAMAIVKGDGKKAAFQEQELLDKLVQSKLEQAKLTADSNSAIADSASRFMAILIAIGAILAVGLGFLITNIIQGQLGGDPGRLVTSSIGWPLATCRCILIYKEKGMTRSWLPCRR